MITLIAIFGWTPAVTAACAIMAGSCLGLLIAGIAE